MKAYAIEVSDLRAVVELRPNWIARLFGAEVTRVTIVRDVDSYQWRTEYQRRLVDNLRHGDEMLRSLDFRPVNSLSGRGLPRATLKEGFPV